MSINKIFPLLFFISLMSLGQVFFKLGALKLTNAKGTELIYNLIKNYWVISAIFLYGFSFFLWLWILKTTPLSFAYSFVSLSFAIVPILSMLIFKENLSPFYGYGVVCLISGVFLLTR